MATGFSFDEIVKYLEGLAGSSVHVEVRPASRSESGAFLGGVLAVRPVPGADTPSYHCQVGDEPGNGFVLSPQDFDYGRIDLYDAESLCLRIRFKDTDYEVTIPDDRLTDESGFLPTG